jgi:CHAT domain-containing protein
VKFETADEKRERVRQADAEYPTAATVLSQMLLGPVAAQLRGKRLLVVPDGALEYLPFAALTVPSKASKGPFVPLMVHHEVTSIPSASTLAVLRRELQGRAPAEKVVAVFADPVFDKADERFSGGLSRNAGGHHGAPAESPGLQRLPYTRQEAEAILSLAPATARKAALGFEANRTAAMSEDLIKYRIIHFATHSFLDSMHPELSAIALSMLDRQGKSQEGFLRSHEVFNLKLSLRDDARLYVRRLQTCARESVGRSGPSHRTVDDGFLSWTTGIETIQHGRGAQGSANRNLA